MISYLGSPSVCVIDDEDSDYEPIITALIEMGIGCSHFRGRNGDPLPPQPLESIKLVFTDLHLSGQVGKAAASHTANVVRKIVPADKGPVLMVIWSKYASDEVSLDDRPVDDQPTEADLFKSELLAADPGYKSRIMFIEMAKPKPRDRPDACEWIHDLKTHITETLSRAEAFQFFWVWESLLRRAGIQVEEALIKLAEQSGTSEDINLTLRLLLRHLAQLQAGPDVAEETIGKHLMAVFAQLGADEIETGAINLDPPIATAWLCEEVAAEDRLRLNVGKKLNGLLHTGSIEPVSAQFTPGTLYGVGDRALMEAVTGFSFAELVKDCCEGSEAVKTAFEAAVTPAFLELTPACDFHQGHRRCATLVAGLVFPAGLKGAKNKDACKTIPAFEDRSQSPPIDISVVFCAPYRLTLPLKGLPSWLVPRLRFREGVLTELRNWHSAQASRAGYLIVN